MGEIRRQEFRFPRIDPITLDQKFTKELIAKRILIREVHGYGGSCTDFDVEIYDREDYSPIAKIYQWDNANVEFHDVLMQGAFYCEPDRHRLFFKIDNNDDANPLDLILRIVYEVLEE